MKTVASKNKQDQRRSNAELVLLYWKVSRCWQDPKRAVREGMSVERAINLLLQVQNEGRGKLATRGRRLLREIVDRQCDTLEEVPSKAS